MKQHHWCKMSRWPPDYVFRIFVFCMYIVLQWYFTYVYIMLCSLVPRITVFPARQELWISAFSSIFQHLRTKRHEQRFNPALRAADFCIIHSRSERFNAFDCNGETSLCRSLFVCVTVQFERKKINKRLEGNQFRRCGKKSVTWPFSLMLPW